MKTSNYYIAIGNPSPGYQTTCADICTGVLEFSWQTIGSKLLSSFHSLIKNYPEKHRLDKCNNELKEWLETLDALPLGFIQTVIDNTLEFINNSIEIGNTIDLNLILKNFTHAFLSYVKWDLKLDKNIDSSLTTSIVMSDGIPEKRIYVVRDAFICIIIISQIKQYIHDFDWTLNNRNSLNAKQIESLINSLTNDPTINLTKSEQDKSQLITFLNQDDISRSKHSISVGCTNKSLWYIMDKLSSIDEKYKTSNFIECGFFKSKNGKVLTRNNWDKSRDLNPKNKHRIDAVFYKVLK